jgi:exopolysaccharide production protein ExoZ
VTIEAPGRDVVSVQMLRAIAATMVMFVHVDHELIVLHFAPLGSAWLSTGVDIFFVISGFIMWTSVERHGDMSARQFIMNRIIRIVPLYWLATTIVVLVALVIPQVLTTTKLQLSHVIASYLFLPARHPRISGVFWPVLVPGWSLNFEMLFYGVFALAIALSPRSRRLRFALISGICVSILLIAEATKGRIDVMNFYANPMLLEFVAGLTLAVAWRAGICRRSWLWLVAIIAGFALLWVGTHYNVGFVVTLVAATLIVAGAVFLPPLRHNALSALGDASYSLYLTHGLTLAAAALAWKHFSLGLPWQLFVLLGCSVAIAVAFLIYNFFEVPMIVALKTWSRASRLPTSAMPAPAPALRNIRKS